MTSTAEATPQPRPRQSKRKRRISHTEARRRGRARRLATRRQLFLNLKNLPDNAVLTFAEWCAFNTLSERQGRRMLASGEGPVITQLSEKRLGITVGANRRWQEARERGRT